MYGEAVRRECDTLAGGGAACSMIYRITSAEWCVRELLRVSKWLRDIHDGRQRHIDTLSR